MEVLAKRAFVAEVGHVDERVGYEAEQSVRDCDVPNMQPVDPDADDREQDSGSDPLNHMPQSQHQQGHVVHFACLIRRG